MKTYLKFAALIASVTLTSICWMFAAEKDLTIISAIIYGTVAISTYLIINPSIAFLGTASETKTIAKVGPIYLVIALFFALSFLNYTLHLISFSYQIQVVFLIVNYGVPFTFWLLMTGIINTISENTSSLTVNGIHRSQLMAALEVIKNSSQHSELLDELIDKLRYSPDDNGAVSLKSNSEILAKIESTLTASVSLNDEAKIFSALGEISKNIDKRNAEIIASRNKS